MKCKIKLLRSLVIIFICSCTNKNPNVEIVRHSSHLLNCEKIFADDLKAIEERNEILLQTGVIDTTDEHLPIRTAIVNIDKNEVELTFEKSYSIQKETTEIYKGSGYVLTLTYEMTKNKFDNPIYKGKFVIETNAVKREFEVEGRTCNL